MELIGDCNSPIAPLPQYGEGGDAVGHSYEEVCGDLAPAAPICSL